MITLHLSAIDLPYEDESTTIGNVTGYLEEKYQVMQTFFDRYGSDIADLMGKDLAANPENILTNAPLLRDLLAEFIPHIHDLFVAFLGNEEMNGMSGVPTRHALLGISRRLKNKKDDPRASFIDTGNYQAAMCA